MSSWVVCVEMSGVNSSMKAQAERVDPAMRRPPGYEWAASQISGMIVDAGLRPGDRLPTERALAERLGVSRTIVREAVRVLSASGMVRARQGSGIYVARATAPFASAAIDLSMPVDPEHMLSLFEFRRTLESEAARLAAERIAPRQLRDLEEEAASTARHASADQRTEFTRADQRLHSGIAEATRNPFLLQSVTTVYRLQGWAMELLIAGAPGSFQVAAEQHAAIVAAIRAGDPDAAAASARIHVETVRAAYQLEVRRRLAGDRAED